MYDSSDKTHKLKNVAMDKSCMKVLIMSNTHQHKQNNISSKPRKDLENLVSMN